MGLGVIVLMCCCTFGGPRSSGSSSAAGVRREKERQSADKVIRMGVGFPLPLTGLLLNGRGSGDIIAHTSVGAKSGNSGMLA